MLQGHDSTTHAHTRPHTHHALVATLLTWQMFDNFRGVFEMTNARLSSFVSDIFVMTDAGMFTCHCAQFPVFCGKSGCLCKNIYTYVISFII